MPLFSTNFNSLAPCGANPPPRLNSGAKSQFQLTRPVWGEPEHSLVYSFLPQISTHSPRVGRTEADRINQEIDDISTHSPRVGRTSMLIFMPITVQISTHSPRVGRTFESNVTIPDIPDFNSLAPCGANRILRYTNGLSLSFQLTRPVWGEPMLFCVHSSIAEHFNSLAPCGANLSVHSRRCNKIHFNSLAPCGANPGVRFEGIRSRNFNSLAPCGANPGKEIELLLWQNFNSLAPCGANQNRMCLRENALAISTHSPRVGRTLITMAFWTIRMISTHSPRVGRTFMSIL